jgi:O-antigen/teichoic acid export membrane protein
MIFPFSLIQKMFFEQKSLYTNSLFIILASLTSAVIGYAFLIVATNLYSKDELGIGIAILSSISLIIIISRVGLEHSLIRFFPGGNKSNIYSTTIFFTLVVTLTIGIIFILGLNFWAPQLDLLRNSSTIFLLLLIINSLISTSGISFIAIRKSKNYFFQNILMSLRIVILFPLAFLGSMGIVYSYGLAATIAFGFSMISLKKYGVWWSEIDIKYLLDSMRFSIGNYIAEIFLVTPTLILTIITLNILGSNAVTDFYIALSLASILFLIPSAFSTSLFVEGSHGEPVRSSIDKTILINFFLLVPAVILIILLGPMILSLFGKDYQNLLPILNILAISSFFVVPFNIFISIKRVEKQIYDLLFFSVILFLSIISFSYILMKEFGVIGISYAWLFTYGLLDIIIILKIFYKSDKNSKEDPRRRDPRS